MGWGGIVGGTSLSRENEPWKALRRGTETSRLQHYRLRCPLRSLTFPSLLDSIRYLLDRAVRSHMWEMQQWHSARSS